MKSYFTDLYDLLIYSAFLLSTIKFIDLWCAKKMFNRNCMYKSNKSSEFSNM